MKILLCITVYNEIEITEKCVEVIKKNYPNIDILLIDDYSKKDIMKSLARKFKVFYISKVNHPGLTNSWNLGYKFFKENNYDILFISNNDLLIPKKTIELLIDNFINTDYLVCIPSSTVKGAGIGKCGKAQGIERIDETDINNHNNYQLVQDTLINNYKYHCIKETNFFNGFFFGLKKNINIMEFSPNILFNPKNINLCNEIDLYNRINSKFKNQNKILHIKHAFIYHFKAITINVSRRDNLKMIEKKYN